MAMIDIVFPSGNEDKFLEMAKLLGYSQLCLVYGEKGKVVDIYERKSEKLEGIILRIKKPKDQSDTRIIIERKSADIIYGLETSEEKDFTHSRNSGLNHILCELASKKGVAIGFSFSSLLNATKKERPVLKGRMMQNLKLCRKYKTKIIIASFAKSPYEMRSITDVKSFFLAFGISQKQAKEGVSELAKLALRKKRELSGEFITDGLDFVD